LNEVTALLSRLLGGKGISLREIIRLLGLREDDFGEVCAIKALERVSYMLSLLGFSLMYNPLSKTWHLAFTEGEGFLPDRVKATLFAVIKLCAGKGEAKIEEVAKERGVEVKTVLEDLKYLERLGFIKMRNGVVKPSESLFALVEL